MTRDLTHSTYLSVSWSVKKAASSEELLTFGPGEGVTTGADLAQRFADGGVRFVPGGNGVFELVISRLVASDSGVYSCTGTEWTSESRKWVRIVQSVVEMGRVTVTPTGQSSLFISAALNRQLKLRLLKRSKVTLRAPSMLHGESNV